jgi:hypothetical protein
MADLGARIHRLPERVTDDPGSDPHARRGLFGLAILALPLLLAVVVFVGYGGLLALGLTGRAGTEPLELAFVGCSEAEPVVAARLADMGFAAVATPAADGFSFAFAGPSDPDVRAALPVDLARTGAFEVRHGDEVLATGADVADASVRVDALMVPTTLLRLRAEGAARVTASVRADPAGQLDFYLDGERIGGQTNTAVTPEEVEIAPPIDDERARLRATAAWSVLIDHPPLPCPVSPRGG